MNQTTHEDFGLFRTELLNVDYITFNLTKLFESDIEKLATYFQDLGFNSFLKKTETSQSCQKIYTSNYSKKEFQLHFILALPYQKDMMQIQFPGLSANQFYKLIKQKKIQWEKLTTVDIVLSRFDIVYERRNKSTDTIRPKEFINSSFVEFQDLHPFKNLLAERNRKGLLLKIGHRKSARHYRIYTGHQNNSLRFEAEMKGECLRFEFEHKYRKTLNLYDHFLKTKQFRKLEQRISYEFLKQTQHLFSYSQETEKVEWLAQRLRPFQTRNNLADSGTTINIHYMQQCSMEKLQKQDLIRLFQLLAYLKLLDGYKTANLRSKFRQYKFSIREFLYFTNPTTEVNQYKLDKTIDFFNSLEHNLVFKFLADKDYRMLVTIPEAYANKVQNRWIAEVWVADEVFNYFEPFLFMDHFKQKKMTIDDY